MKKNTWTKEQLDMLKTEYPTIRDPRDLALKLGKTYLAMKTRARILKLFRTVPPGNYGRTRATAEQDQYIKDNYQTIPASLISRQLGFSETLVRGRMRFLKLVVPQEIKEKFRKESQIKPGNIPLNKGRKMEEWMRPDSIERVKKTQYKKGQIPPNKAHYRDDDITLRPDKTGRIYKWIRISLRVWKMLHVVNWEKVNGPVPKGHIIVFKDKNNTMDCDVERLEMITLKENMLRNSASMNLTDGYVANCIAWHDKEMKEEIKKHPGLIKLKRQSLILNRKINEQAANQTT